MARTSARCSSFSRISTSGKSPDLYGDAILAKLRKRFAAEVPEALVNVFPPPAVSGLGRAGGFKFMVEDRGDVGLVEAAGADRQPRRQRERSSRRWPACSPSIKANSPQLFVDVDRKEC